MPENIRNPAIPDPAAGTFDLSTVGGGDLNTKFAAAFAGAVLLVMLGVALTFWSFNQMKEVAEERKHTFTVIISAETFLSQLKDAETGERGYLLTGDETFLQPYLAVRDSIHSNLEQLRQLTQIRAADQHLDALSPIVDAKMAELAQIIELRRKHDTTAALAIVSKGQNKRLMDTIREGMQSFVKLQQDALAQHEAEYQSNLRIVFILIVGFSLAVLLSAFAFAYFIYRQTQQRLMNLVHAQTVHLLESQKESNQQLQQANITLQESEEKLAVTLHSIGDAVISTDGQARVMLLNPVAERLTGWTHALAVGRPIDEVFHIINKETRQLSTIPVLETLAHGTLHGLANHTVLIARDGSERDIADSCAPIRDRDDRVIGAVLVFRDVTEEYALQHTLSMQREELEGAKIAAETANLAKSDFLSSMSHELRTPLNAILGFTQLLENGPPQPTDAQLIKLHQVSKAGWYLLELINEILDLAVIESGKLALSQEAVSLAEVMQECQGMIEAQAQKRGIDIDFLPFDNTWYVYADRTRMKQALINLLTNSVKYNREQGTVEVKCTCTPKRIRISIKDTGEGLSPEKLSQLFQPFNRLGQENGPEEGTGIGLVVTKQVIELMGGTISVESTVGIGSEFLIELPRDVAPQLAAGYTFPIEIGSQAHANAAIRTLLYVEDNPANLMLVEQIIERNPQIHMLSAINGDIGIALARAHLPDVILMDINLSGMSGVEAMQILRQDPATAHIPVVALSANAMPRDIEKGLEAGFFRYLTKPIKINEFMQALNEAFKLTESGLAVDGRPSSSQSPEICA